MNTSAIPAAGLPADRILAHWRSSSSPWGLVAVVLYSTIRNYMSNKRFVKPIANFEPVSGQIFTAVLSDALHQPVLEVDGSPSQSIIIEVGENALLDNYPLGE
jgi:hypothetical protein